MNITLKSITVFALTALALAPAAPMAGAAPLKSEYKKARISVQQFKAPEPRAQQIIQGCEDDVSQTSYDGPCNEYEDTIVIEGCHNNQTQTSEPGRCPE